MNVDKACGQEKFQTPDECFSKDTSENHNDWKMLSTQPSPDANEDEVMDLVDDVPGAFEAAAAREVQIGGFGACGAEDGHHIVQFKSEPHALEADPEDVEGVDLIAAASMIWEAVCWNPIKRAKRWCTPPPHTTPHRLFCLRHVVAAAVAMETPSNMAWLPSRRDKAHILSLNPMRAHEQCHVQIFMLNSKE